jgi:hypothetical protein
MWRNSVFDIYFTEFCAVLTTVLPALFKYCYKYCYRYFDKILVSEYKRFKRSNKANLFIALVQWPVSQMKMTFQEIRILATVPCIANQLRYVNTICRRSWYIAAHIWKIYDFKIIISYKTIRLIRSLKTFIFRYQDLVEKYSVSAETIINDGFS